MLEHVPEWLGRALSGWRAGAEALAVAQPGLAGPGGLGSIDLGSPAFADGARMPPRFTADGEGMSPPLVWSAPPPGTTTLALLVEDADAPASQPLVHAIVWGLAPEAGSLAEGAIGPDPSIGATVGRNSFLRQGWLPPDPPTGHGGHRYVFQLFAVGSGAGDPGAAPGRGDLLDAIRGHVLGAGVLTGAYGRGEPGEIGPAGAPAAA